jgi:hypothetical protein
MICSVNQGMLSSAAVNAMIINTSSASFLNVASSPRMHRTSRLDRTRFGPEHILVRDFAKKPEELPNAFQPSNTRTLAAECAQAQQLNTSCLEKLSELDLVSAPFQTLEGEQHSTRLSAYTGGWDHPSYSKNILDRNIRHRILKFCTV